MSLNSTLLASHLSALAASAMATTVTYQLKTAGAWGSVTSLAASVTQSTRGETFGEMGREQRIVDSITVIPLVTPPAVRLGDRIIYNAETFTVVKIDGETIPSWTCEHSERAGIQRGDGFRAQGGGA